MRAGKDFLRKKLIEFQLKIADLDHSLTEQRNLFQDRETALCLGLLDILDAFENIDDTIEAKKDNFDKTTFLPPKSVFLKPYLSPRLAFISLILRRAVHGFSQKFVQARHSSLPQLPFTLNAPMISN